MKYHMKEHLEAMTSMTTVKTVGMQRNDEIGWWSWDPTSVDTILWCLEVFGWWSQIAQIGSIEHSQFPSGNSTCILYIYKYIICIYPILSYIYIRIWNITMNQCLTGKWSIGLKWAMFAGYISLLEGWLFHEALRLALLEMGAISCISCRHALAKNVDGTEFLLTYWFWNIQKCS